MLAAFRTYLDLLRPDSEVLEQVPDDPTVLSHLVAATAQLTTDERQRLLAAPDTATRLRAELRLLNREAGLLAGCGRCRCRCRIWPARRARTEPRRSGPLAATPGSAVGRCRSVGP